MGEPQFLRQSRLTGNKQSQHFRNKNKRNKDLFLAHSIAHCELAEGDFVPHNSLRLKLTEAFPSLLLTLLWVLKSSWSLEDWQVMWVIMQDILGARPGSGNILSTHIPLTRTNHIFSSYCRRGWEMWLGWVPRRLGAHQQVSVHQPCVTLQGPWQLGPALGMMKMGSGAGEERERQVIPRGSSLGKWTLKQLWKSSVWTTAKLMPISLQCHRRTWYDKG